MVHTEDKGFICATKRAFAATLPGALLIAALVAIAPETATAQVCNGFISLDNNFLDAATPAEVGDIRRIRIGLGTGEITGGAENELQIDRVRFALDCSDAAALGLPCLDDGMVVSFQGNITTANCLDSTGTEVGFTCDIGVDEFLPNEVVCTPTSQIQIAANSGPDAAGACELQFDVQVESISNDSSPFQIGQVAGYRIVMNIPDAQCDNGADSTGSQSSFVDLATFTPTPTPTETPTDTPTNTPTDTPTNTPTNTPEDTPTNTPTDTPEDTPTNTPTDTPEDTPTNTPTPTATDTPTNTPTNTPGEEEICRTKGFWGTHTCPQTAGGDDVCEKSSSQNITQQVIDAAGGSILVCGETLTDTHLNHQHSAQEALCVSPRGDQLLQLASQLTAAALNCVVSGGPADCSASSTFGDLFGVCNSACAEGDTTTDVDEETINCIDAIDCLNNGGNFDVETGECVTGTCLNGAPCNDETPCADESECTPLPGNCHDQPLCNEEDDGGLCFEPPGPAGGSKQCSAANTNECTIFSGSPPCAE